MFRTISKRAYNTFKSKNDEQANQALLERLRKVPTLARKTIVEKSIEIRDEDIGCLTFEQLNKLIQLNITDALLWDTSTLSRIFKIREDYCEHIVNHVKPMVYFLDRYNQKKLLDISVVIDVARLKYDKSYLPEYQSLVFFDNKQRLPLMSTEEVIVVRDK